MIRHARIAVSRTICALALSLAALAVRASPIYVGNLAPDVGQTPEADLLVDGHVVAEHVAYKAFVQVDFAYGTHAVEFRRSGTDDTLATLNAYIAPPIQPIGRVTLVVIPTLVLAGNGSDQPHTVELLEEAGIGSATASSPSGPPVLDSAIALHHLAPFPGANLEESRIGDARGCEATLPNGVHSRSESGGRIRYREQSMVNMHADDQMSCTYQMNSPITGGVEISGIHAVRDATLRVFLIGDGHNQPFELLEVVGANVVQAAHVPQPLPSSLIHSSTFWRDAARPGQGVQLFDAAAAQSTYGIWYTFSDDALSGWYYLDGVGTGAPGRRDMVVYQLDRDGGELHRVAVGSARLTYDDCNHALLNIVLGSGDVRNLHLERSRAVASCTAFDF